MRRLVIRHTLPLVLLFGAGIALAPASYAQVTSAPAPTATPIPRPANDSLYRRARKLVLEGNGAAGRAIVDTLLAHAAPGTPEYGDALYWHGALSATIADAERDYRRVIVEYPLAFYADDALLAIAELEQGRGDRAGALAHLQRFVKEHPASPARGIAALGAARLAFEQRDTRIGCAMITEARASAGTGDVELSNQIAYYSARCPGHVASAPARMGSVPTRAATPVDTQSSATKSGVPRATPDPLPATPAVPASPATSADPAAVPARTSPPVAAAPVAPVVAAPSAPPVRAPAVAPARDVASAPGRSASHGRYTIQLAAFNTRPEAERFVATVAKRGLRARVSGDAKPFRVRLDYYPTRGAAAAEVAALRARGIVGFVAEEPATPRAGQAREP